MFGKKLLDTTQKAVQKVCGLFVEESINYDPFINFLATAWDELSEESKQEILRIAKKGSSHDQYKSF